MRHTIIFDLDGTLANSALLTIAAFEAVAPKYGLPLPTAEKITRTIGYANPEFYFRLFPDSPRETVAAFGAAIEAEETRQLPRFRKTLLFEGCRKMLAQLHACGIHLHIASTGDHNHVYGILQETGIIGYFDQVRCGHSDKTDMLRELAAHKDKNGMLMVGDMRKDYEAARANGILSVGACYGYCDKKQTDFDLYAHTPDEILGLSLHTLIKK